VIAYKECKKALGTSNADCWHNMKCDSNPEGISGRYYNCYVNLPGHLIEVDGKTEAEAHFYLSKKCSKRKGMSATAIMICMSQRICTQEYR
jgi:hypothetical protein